MTSNPTKPSKRFLDGNQAAAWAALDADVHYVAHYPGSPVNRVVPEIEREGHGSVRVNHALNEHIAALSAMGASLCGARSLLVMKHVGLNIASDPLNYAGVSQIKGGMVVVVGTDPGARCSTGEEDVHWYAAQFNMPLLEPTDTQTIYDCVLQGFSISETYRTPVLVFVPERLAYQAATVQRKHPTRIRRTLRFEQDNQQLINVGQRAVTNHSQLIARMKDCAKSESGSNTIGNTKAAFGIITRGASYSVTVEQLVSLGIDQDVHLFNCVRPYPLNVAELFSFVASKTRVLIIEDQDGFLETMVKRELFGKTTCQIDGKSVFPASGEITPEMIHAALCDELGLESVEQGIGIKVDVPERPGTFCEGCPHRPVFYAIDRAIREQDGIVGGDIGCSSLPPHRTDWLLCMNAGVGISQGIAQLNTGQALVSTGGEGSLFHGGLLALQSAVENGIDLVHVLLDNRSIAMTGHQASPTQSQHVDVPALLKAIGVAKVFSVDAFKPSEVETAIDAAQALSGVKVVWVQGDCALQPGPEIIRRRRERTLSIDNARCGDCRLCYQQLQCPAIELQQTSNQLIIDMTRCSRCAACLDVCPNQAIIVEDPALEMIDA